MRSPNLRGLIPQAEASVCRHYGVTAVKKRLPVTTVFDGPVNRPPVLLPHGISSATILAAPPLSTRAERQVVAVDWPGHGLSDACDVSLGRGALDNVAPETITTLRLVGGRTSNAASICNYFRALLRRSVSLTVAGHGPWLQSPDRVGNAVAEHLAAHLRVLQP